MLSPKAQGWGKDKRFAAGESQNMMRRSLFLLSIFAVCWGDKATAQSPMNAIPNAVALCQSWLDAGEEIGAGGHFVKLVQQDYAILYANTNFQVLIAAEDRSMTIEKGQRSDRATMQSCTVYQGAPTFDLSLSRMFKGPIDLVGVWEASQPLADDLAVSAVEQVMKDYNDRADYVIAREESYFPESQLHILSLGRCTDEHEERIQFNWVSPSNDLASNARIELLKSSRPFSPQEYLIRCQAG